MTFIIRLTTRSITFPFFFRCIFQSIAFMEAVHRKMIYYAKLEFMYNSRFEPPLPVLWHRWQADRTKISALFKVIQNSANARFYWTLKNCFDFFLIFFNFFWNFFLKFFNLFWKIKFIFFHTYVHRLIPFCLPYLSNHRTLRSKEEKQVWTNPIFYFFSKKKDLWHTDNNGVF